MFPVTLIHEQAQQQGLKFLLIGGHAVNSYCEPRATLDVDFLIPKTDAPRWRDLLEREGFKGLNAAENFLQFSPPYGVNFRLDLMLVNDATFSKLQASARQIPCLGKDMLVPSALNLIALKVHAIHHGHAERRSKDWLDVENLARAAGLDPKGKELAEVFRRYGTPDLYAELLKRIPHDNQT